MSRTTSTLASIALVGLVTTAVAAPFELGTTVADRSRRGMGGGKRGNGATFDPTTELDPNWSKLGKGCCRSQDDEASIVAASITYGVESQKACRLLCQNFVEGCCIAIEYNKRQGRCELYQSDARPAYASIFKESDSDNGCTATACWTRDRATEPSALQTFVRIGDGCCRTEDGEDSVVSTKFVDLDIYDKRNCKQACNDDPTCIGFEISADGGVHPRCELYSEAGRPVSTTPWASSPARCRSKTSCFAKECPSF